MNQADAIAGYTTYIDLIQDLIQGKEIISTGMTKEVERVEKAINQALSGKTCAIVSSGDPGIYAMAGLVFELCRKNKIALVRHGCESVDTEADGDSRCLEIEIVPGIPALAAGASLVGAPLTHDFAVISLSDLLTPWETIEKRIKAASAGDFVIVIYNPKSRKRDWQLKRATEIMLEYKEGKTPVGIVTGAMRSNQKVTVVTLDQLDTSGVDMQTVLFIGNSTSVEYGQFMYTPRGYAGKYTL